MVVLALAPRHHARVRQAGADKLQLEHADIPGRTEHVAFKSRFRALALSPDSPIRYVTGDLLDEDCAR
jgi:hypothetical protein